MTAHLVKTAIGLLDNLLDAENLDRMTPEKIDESIDLAADMLSDVYAEVNKRFDRLQEVKEKYQK